MRVLGCTENGGEKEVQRLAQQGIRRTTLDDLLRRSDFVSVHVPLQDSTRYLIDEHAIALMKPGAFLVNLARGGVVDEAALQRALANGQLAGAGLDVHEREGDGNVSPLAGFDNVVLTPHIGANTHDTQREIGAVIVRTIESFEGEMATVGDGLPEPDGTLRECGAA